MSTKKKVHPKVAATGRPDVSEIEEMFEKFVEIRVAQGTQSLNSTFVDGVAQALGWVIGQYSDPPE
jgi:hypothetical protein